MGGVLRQETKADVVSGAKLGHIGRHVGRKVIPYNNFDVFGRQALDVDQKHLFLGF
jgi:hypothetical protein